MRSAIALYAPLLTMTLFSANCVAGARVKTGFEVLAEGHFALLRGKRIGMITNPTAVLPDLRHEADVLSAESGAKLMALFGAEHGLRGVAQAGGTEELARDPHTGVPVYDIYAQRGQALVDIFNRSGAEVLLFDMQDAGARYYTFAWTLYDCLEAAALANKPLVVLDRPNPIGGVAVEGPVLHREFATLVGRQPIAQRHGLTPGELALLFNGEFIPKAVGRPARLTVVPLEGWSRDMYYDETGLPWVMPSPNLPTVDSALAFAGTALFEGTNLSEGRGTTRPFELIGAPFVDGRLVQSLRAARLPGVRFREAYFRPTFDKYRDATVGGVQLYVTDRKTFAPVRTAIEMLVRARALYKELSWRRGQGQQSYWIDHLSGSERLREAIDAGKSADEIVQAYQDELQEFIALRSKYLLYRTRSVARAEVPPWAAEWFDESRPATALREGRPAEAGLVGWFIRRMDAHLRAGLQPNPRIPSFSGAVALAAKHGVIVFQEAVGDAVRFTDGNWTELPEGQRVPAHLDTIFDLASLSKLFTTVAAMQLVESGKLELHQTVAHYLPEFSQNGKATVTVEQLLTHTSGLVGFIKLWEAPQASSLQQRTELIYALAPVAPPGSKYIYSDLNMIVLQQIIERLSGEPLDRYVAAHITGPLRMVDTGYNPPPYLRPRVAATEYEEGPRIHRGMVRGSVHDENAWSLGGVAGNAGVFSTAHDLAIFAQMILNGGRYGDVRILQPATVLDMVSLHTPALFDEYGAEERGLGFELDADYYMGPLASLTTVGHTGYTGTSLVIDLKKKSFLILLSNAVHPVRLKRNIRSVRESLATDLAFADPQFFVPYVARVGGLTLLACAALLVTARLIVRRRQSRS
jgi:uncharacterized protein YbbC (DUF1343 family)/CubicO group peptidase (beta-lactamase class C family)